MTDDSSPHFSLGAVVRLTGLTDHTIRAWERRYAAVTPSRTAGGTRRYSPQDVARLRLLRAGVDAGHRISELAPHSDAALENLLETETVSLGNERSHLAPIREAVDRLDLQEAERLLSTQFAALGATRFAHDVAAPLLHEIGERWQAGTSSVSSEHMLSAVTRGILGVALRASGAKDGPKLLFTTPQGELHELGALIAAIVAMGAGASITFLGPNMPADEVARAAAQVGARAVALGVVTLPPDDLRAYLATLRRQLPGSTALWVGGPAVVEPMEGVQHLELEEMELLIQSWRK